MSNQHNAQLGSTFERLVTDIRRVHEILAARAGRAINVCLSVRNWMIGHTIVNYEQNGSDRATYGEQLLENLALRLKNEGLARVDSRELRRYRQFYLTYPQIRESLSPEMNLLIGLPQQDASAEMHLHTKIRETPSPELPTPTINLLTSLSFSHFDLLMQVDDPTQRLFYEVECLRGNWSVRELKRQISSLYFERSALSQNKEELGKLAHSDTEKADLKSVVRDPYVFEFLGLNRLSKNL